MTEIVITAGHGAGDPGAVAKGVKEADLATELRDIIAIKLLDEGFTVYTDGEKGVNQPLRDALALVKAHPKALAIELHCNAAANIAARGVESISLPPLKGLCQNISMAIANVLADQVRGDKGWIDQSQSARGKLGYVEAGGIIVELFFLSNPTSLAVYQSKKWLVASAIVQEIKKWANSKN